MDLSLNEEQKQIKALVREFCQREVDQADLMQRIRKNDAATFTMDNESAIAEIRKNHPHDLVRKSWNAGLHFIGVPTKYGGPGPDTNPNMAMAVALEEAGYSGGLAGGLLIGPGMGGAVRVNPYYTEEEREEYFENMLASTGEEHGGGTISEPISSVDSHYPYDEGGNEVLKVTARKDGDEWVINGQKQWSTNGAIADSVTCWARTKDGPVSTSMSQFRVPRNTPGVSVSLNRMIFNLWGNGQWNYDNVRVPADALMGRENEAWLRMMFNFPLKWQIRSWGVGLCMRLYEHMYEYAKQRMGGGKPIIQHTDTAHRLGELAMHLEALRAFHFKAAWECDQMEQGVANGAPVPPLFNFYYYHTFLAYLKKVSFMFAEYAHDIYGSMAGAIEMPVESFLRYNMVWRGAAMPPAMLLIRASEDYESRAFYEPYVVPAALV